MQVKITPTEKPEVLAENLRKRVESVETDGQEITAELEEPEMLGRTPGVESYEAEGKKVEGLKGSPVDEQAYARLDSKRDAVLALLATIMGYDLRFLDPSRRWDYRNLKRYNPDIKQLDFDEPRKELGIQKALFDAEGLEKIEIELEDEEVESIYRSKLA